MKSTLTGSCYHVILIITVIYDVIGKNLHFWNIFLSSLSFYYCLTNIRAFVSFLPNIYLNERANHYCILSFHGCSFTIKIWCYDKQVITPNFISNKRLWEDNMLFKRFFVKTFQDIKHEYMNHVWYLTNWTDSVSFHQWVLHYYEMSSPLVWNVKCSMLGVN